MKQLDLVVAAHDLNEHPFYRAWRAGTLPRESLACYAVEYGRFIAVLADGWNALGHREHAEEEREHARLWNDFRGALGAEENSSSNIGPCEEVTALVRESLDCFADRASAAGALYAFEAQQPSTAKSKLEGLRAHYDVGAAGEEYFRLHADDYGEKELLSREITGLSAQAQTRAKDACERTCRAMWRALDGVLRVSLPV